MAVPANATLFPSPVPSQAVDVVTTITRTNDNALAGKINELIAYLGGTGIGVLTFGTHLTGTSYNTTANVTLGTDATELNTASTIVARDASGNFVAGTITAALSGNATTATTAAKVANALTAGSYLTSAGTFDGAAARTFSVDATDANTASKVVARDASGNFSAGTITATLNGAAPAGSLTGTTLAANVVTSSLTSVGTLTSLTVSATVASPTFLAVIQGAVGADRNIFQATAGGNLGFTVGYSHTGTGMVYTFNTSGTSDSLVIYPQTTLMYAGTAALASSIFANTATTWQITTDLGGTARGVMIGVDNPGMAPCVGSRTNHDFELRANNISRWVLQTGGNFVAKVDNSYDIGNAADYRPREVFVAGRVYANKDLLIGSGTAFMLMGA